MCFVKKRNQLDNTQLEVMRDIADDVIESDFVPYACLFDPDTILAKNGELMQVIKITGFTYEALSHEDADLRSVIRAAISSSIHSNDYAVWFHTIRRKKRLSPDGDYPDAFSSRLHDAWKRRNDWDRKYINELYITIVREGQSADISNIKGFFDGVIPAIDRKIRNAYLDRVAPELDATVSRLIKALREFGAKRLTIVKREGVYYGEHLEFLEKLINLEERPMPICQMDLSDQLTSGEISFAYNAMEVRTAEGERRFGAILTIKEYKEASLYKIDEILHLPCEFIVTQCMDFVNSKRALKSYEDQKYFVNTSGDTDLAELSELDRVFESAGSDMVGYAQHQMTMFVIGMSVSELERTIKLMRDEMSKIGIVAIREDLKFEECYWAQMPSNFAFVSRLSYINTNRAAGFVNIQNYPAGNAKGCPWGPPVTLFYTAAGTPYFFNFHLGYTGHTSIVGPYGAGKTVLMNFLLSESRKYQNRLFYLDANASAKPFIEALGGNYYDLSDPNSTYHHLSPLSLPDQPMHREFLALWLTTLIDSEGTQINEPLLVFLKTVVQYIYQLEPAQRTLSNVADYVAQHDPALAAHFAQWYGEGEYAFFFDHIGESVEPKNGIIGFNLSAFMDFPAIRVPVASYLIHRITMTLDGTPSIFVLDEAWQLLNAPMFGERAVNWLHYLTTKNAFAILTTEKLDALENIPFAAKLVEQMVTEIYLPNEDPEDVYETVFGLTDEEYAYLDAMSVEYRHFMLKRANESIIAELNLGGMDEVLAVLSGDMSIAEESRNRIQAIELMMDNINQADEEDA